MSLQMMYITNDIHIAKIAQSNTVDIIFVDLETRGKNARQAGMNTVKSNHVMEDVGKIKDVLTTSKLLVRVNPLYENSKAEIDGVIAHGADIVMLPMFSNATDAERFVDIVNGRAKVMLLVETKQAESNISQISDVAGVDGIHIGLNDLHIAHGKTFMFELLADGNVETMCKAIANRSIPYGFGGIARLNEGTLPARNIIAEHYRLGSSRVILSRSFCNADKLDLDEAAQHFETGMREIREFERQLPNMTDEFFRKNKEELCEKTKMIVSNIIRGRS